MAEFGGQTAEDGGGDETPAPGTPAALPGNETAVAGDWAADRGTEAAGPECGAAAASGDGNGGPAVAFGGGPDRGVLDGPHLRRAPQEVVVQVAGRRRCRVRPARGAGGSGGG